MIQIRKRFPKVVLLLLALIVGAGFFVVKGRRNGTAVATPSDSQKPVKLYEVKLDGTKIPDEALSNRRPLAIMIENHVDARPQWGLPKASLIFEAIAEGGITRFMAVYGPNDSDKIGPVRSARLYYLDWAKELNALYAHVGGNIAALDLIPKIGIADLNQFSIGERAFWRVVNGKATEHTMYTSTKKLYEVAESKKMSVSADFDSLKFKDDTKEGERGSGQVVTVVFSSPEFTVKWTYDPKTNAYFRSHGGVAHKDAGTGEQVNAKTVAVATVKRSPLISRDEKEVWQMTTVGSGSATVFIDGKEIKGTWKKESREKRMRFYDSEVNEISVNRGQAWIEIIPPEGSVTSTALPTQ
jgi:hypothetical protein